jgi:hypothetical protein
MEHDALRELFLFARDHNDSLANLGYEKAAELGMLIDGVSQAACEYDPGTAAVDLEMTDGTRYAVSAMLEDV